jgi:putative tricarboxylic transport membrane protein
MSTSATGPTGPSGAAGTAGAEAADEARFERGAPAPGSPGGAAPPAWTGPRIVGAVLLALGVLALIATFDIASARDGWAIQGPRFAPLVASILLIMLSIAFLVRTVVRPDVELARYAAAEADATHWPTPAALLALLVGYALLLTALGYALATTIFVWLTAWLLGSERPVRDAIVGVVLGVVAGYAFGHWLNVQLPTGPWGV